MLAPSTFADALADYEEHAAPIAERRGRNSLSGTLNSEMSRPWATISVPHSVRKCAVRLLING